MAVLLRNVTLSLDQPEEQLGRLAAKILRVREDRVLGFHIVKKSLDSRRGRRPSYLYSLALDLEAEVEAALYTRKRVPIEPYVEEEPPEVSARPASEPRPVVVGAGPSGLFAAYRLAQAGTPAIVIERGEPVKERSKSWFRFLKGEPFDPESNLLFGEGGAGTYSDGKLYTRVHDVRVGELLKILIDCGAPAEIGYEAKPHIGSNRLPSIIRRLRERLIAAGTEFRFSTRVAGLHLESTRAAQRVAGVELEPGGTLAAEVVFLGLGHSARDTFRMLAERGVRMEPKPFQLGARIEHPQSVVDAMQYREAAGHPNLPPADYRLVAKRAGGDCFSFCMCPGGEILPSTEKSGFICVNGASKYKRIGEFANSGFVITIPPEKFQSRGHALDGIGWQEEIERRAAALAAHEFGAPALRLRDFLDRRLSAEIPPSSYPLPLTPAPFDEFMPSFVVEALREGLSQITTRIPLLDHPEAIITGPESRSSSPVRIVRDPETYESLNTTGLYPMGEGAGFAGGIMSAAIDGMRAVEAMLRTRSRS